MSGFITEVVTRAEGLNELSPEWDALWRRSPVATPFQAPAWLMPWWNAFAPGELRSIVVRTGGRVVGFVPLYLEQALYGSRLLPIGISLSDYSDILFDPEYPEALPAIRRALEQMNDWRAVEWPELPSGSVASEVFKDQWRVERQAGSTCPYVEIEKGVTSLRSLVSPSRWRHLRTARNRAARRGSVNIFGANAVTACSILRELIRLHAASAGGRGANVFSDKRVETFHYTALPELMNTGLLRLYAMQIDDDVAAVYYGFHHRDRAYAYCSGYDPNFSFESPGALLIAHAMEEAIREGAREFDFLRGQESYKYEWGAKDRRNAHLIAVAKEPVTANV